MMFCFKVFFSQIFSDAPSERSDWDIFMGPPGASPWSVPGSDFSKRRTQGRKYGKLLHDLSSLRGDTYLVVTLLDYSNL